MGCSSCSTGKDGKPGGCRSNGTCDTGGCNKLNVYNWLADMVLPSGQKAFDVVEVRFKGSRKEFYKNKEMFDLKTGDVVAVEASPGHDVGVISMTGELVRFQMKKKNLTENSDHVKTLYRKAKPNEIEKWYEVKDQETPMLHRTREIIQSLKLNMKLSDVEIQGDGKKSTFFYTADDRVDFRELIKKLAEEFRLRVEMRQIGMRQEASRLGGIGVCGRELCCSTWLTDFKTVSTNTARYQNLALNPAKLAGQCGKLKCCLNYELDSYLDAIKDFPSTNIVLETAKGRAFHRKTDIFKRLMWYAFTSDERKEHGEGGGSEGGDGGNWVPMHVDRVKEIIELNKQAIKPTELGIAEIEEITETVPDYANVVGQDRIDRMDKKKKKKKKKKKPGAGSSEARPPQQPGSPQAPRPPQQPRPGGEGKNTQQTRPQQQQQKGQGGSSQNPRPPQQQNSGQPRQQSQNQSNQQNRRPRQNQGQPDRSPQNQPSPPARGDDQPISS